jgi:hypothetical protein
MTLIKKNQLRILLSFLLFVYGTIAILHFDKTWMNSFLQIGAIILTIVFTLIVIIENNKVIAIDTERQINALSENTDKRIKAISENTDRQIHELQRLTGKQIEHYQQETQKLVEQLKDNSELLAGILQRHLEDTIEETQKELKAAEHDLNEAKNFKIFRTDKEKEIQIQNKTTFVQRIGKKLNYVKGQYSKLMSFIRGYN